MMKLPNWIRHPSKVPAAMPSNQLVVDVLEDNLVDRLAPQAIDLLDDDCVAFSGTEWLRIWYVQHWPRTLGQDNWRKLLHFPAELRLSIFMEPFSPGLISKQLEMEETAIQASRFLRAHQKRDASPSEDQALSEIRAERHKIEVQGEPFYYLTVCMALFADTREHLDEWSQKLESHARDAGITLGRGRWQHEDGMLALLPHNLNTLGNHRRNARLDALTNMFPFVGDEIVMPEAFLRLRRAYWQSHCA
ncbi:MAG: hypothetical protein HC853_08615 [Anaerolineae bacterium]|nr:hypothetical protein [Anaerolineae bacterium]